MKNKGQQQEQTKDKQTIQRNKKKRTNKNNKWQKRQT